MTFNNSNSLSNNILGKISTINQSAINSGVITITGSGSSGQNSLLDSFKVNYNQYCVEKLYYESTIDSLVISCVRHRLRKNNAPSLVGNIQAEELYLRVTTEDHTLATEIRNFYQQRFMVWKLKDKKLSKFREDLQKYINSDGKLYPNEYSGMISRLPEFYEYDLAVTEIKLSNFDSTVKIKNFYGGKTLKPIKKLTRSTRSMKRVNYWFSDSNNAGVLFSVETSNILLNVFDQIFSNNTQITVHGTYNGTDKEDFEHYALTRIQSLTF